MATTRDKDRPAPSALEDAAAAPDDDGPINRLTSTARDLGIDGLGPLPSAQAMAEEALADSDGDVEAAVKRVARRHLAGGAIGGFLTSLGGFVTMPVALPLNVAEFYVQATRMVAGIAHLRGYDLQDPSVRTAVVLTLVGSDLDEVLTKAGVAAPLGAGRVASFATGQLPPSVMMIVNKGIGFRLLQRASAGRLTSRLGRGVPLVGGAIGGGLDAYMMKRIADHAMIEFPARS